MNILTELYFSPVNDNFFMVLVGHKVLRNFLSWLWWWGRPQQEQDRVCTSSPRRSLRPSEWRGSTSTSSSCSSRTSRGFPPRPAWSGKGLFSQTTSRRWSLACLIRGGNRSCHSVADRSPNSWGCTNWIIGGYSYGSPKVSRFSSWHTAILV